jgi:hypothetical protein
MRGIEMVAKNDVTQTEIRTPAATDAYRDGWTRVFGMNMSERVWIEDDEDGYVNLIVDYHLNENNQIRLSPVQYENLVAQIINRETAKAINAQLEAEKNGA